MPRLPAFSRSLVASLLAALGSAVAAAANKPNVLMIVVDDLSAPAIAHPAFGNTHVSARTPAIDRLANEGVSFTQAYANWPSCAPARQAFMSGALPEKTQYRFYGNVRELAGRNRSVVYMGQHFKNNGYSTIRLDKIYHIGRDVASQWDVTEEPFGVNRNEVTQQASEFGKLGYTDGKVVNGVTLPDDRLRYEKFTEMGGEKSEIIELKPAKSDGTPITADTLTDGITKQRALFWLDDLATPGGQFDASQKPFFLAVGFRRPHLPFLAPTSYYRKFKWGDGDTNFEPGASNIVLPPHNQAFTDVTQFRKALEGYYACLLMTDDHIGQILNKLDQTGLAQDTIVVFYGDHGYGLGEKDKYFSKGTEDNTGFHTPIIFRVPGGRQNAAVAKAVTLVDVYPTLSDLCGLPRPQTPLDGSSLVPLLQKDDPDWVENAIAFLGDNEVEFPLMRFVWAEGHKYYEDNGVANQLYAVGAGDPFEWTNLRGVAAHSALQARMKARLDSLVARSLARIAPDLLQHPLSQAVAVGRPALFSVRPAGNKTFTVQWFKNGAPLGGQTGTSLVIPAVQAADAGNYSATVVNDIGRTLSFPAELKVLASAGGLFDWQIDNTHAPYILDGINGAPFEAITNGSGKFNNTLHICYYAKRDGYAYVRPGLPGGSYRVSIHRPSIGNGTTEARHIVNHRAGNSTVVVNLSDSTRGWQVLGTYDLGPASGLSIGTRVPVAEQEEPNKKYVNFDGARFERLSALANSVPVAVNDAAQNTTPDTAITLNVLSNDTDGDGDALTIHQIAGGRFGAVTFSGGNVTYTPHPGVVSGTETIHYQATDGKDVSNPASFTVTIAPAANTSVVAVTTNDAGTVAHSGGKTTYVDGTNVTFTATPHPGYQFYHWAGTTETTQNPLTVAVSGATELQAVFRPLTTITSYSAWAATQPWSNAGSQNPRATDADGDGLTNAAEYAFDLDPLRPGDRPERVETGPDGTGGTALFFRYRRNLRAVGINYVVKVSDDLVNWQTFAGPQVVSSWNPDGDFSAQEMELGLPLSGGRKFVRVEAVVP
jgi:arylsulfatase A-like enzyme